MVQEANVKRAHAEKALAESEMKVSKSSSRMFMFTYIIRITRFGLDELDILQMPIDDISNV